MALHHEEHAVEAADFHFATLWERVADRYPHRLAAVCDGKSVTWQDFEERAARVAAMLQEHGLDEGSKAAIYAHNSNEYQEAQFGIFKIGGCPINVNYRYIWNTRDGEEGTSSGVNSRILLILE